MEELLTLFPSRTLLLMTSLVLLLGVLAQVLSRRFRIPAVIFLMAIGLLFGTDGLDFIHPQEYGLGLRTIILSSVAIIVLEGTALIDLAEVRRHWRSLTGLLTAGAGVTFLLTTLAIHWILKLDWPLATLAGSILSLTGPTVLFPILKRLPLKRDLKVVLEAESVLVDAVGVLLTSTIYSFINFEEVTAPLAVQQFFENLLIGGLIGGLTAWTLGKVLKGAREEDGDLISIAVLALTLFGYALAELCASYSGIIMVAIVGLFLGNYGSRHIGKIHHLLWELTLIALSLVFILLTASVSIEGIFEVGWRGVAIALLLVFLIRPLAVFLATLRSGLSGRERAFIAWMGPRGLVSASMATLMSISLQSNGLKGIDFLGPLVLLTVLVTVAIQGGTADFVAEKLGLLSEEKTVPEVETEVLV